MSMKEVKKSDDKNSKNKVEEEKKNVLKDKLKAFDIGAMKLKTIQQKAAQMVQLKKQEKFRSLNMLGEIQTSLKKTGQVIYSNIQYANAEDATFDKIKKWLEDNEIHSLNLMAVKANSDCVKIPGMYRGTGQQIAKQAYFFPFVPIAFITTQKGSFTPPRVNLTKSGKKYASALQAVTYILQGRAPWVTEKFFTEEAFKGMLLANPVKMSTVQSLIKAQTIPVKEDGSLVFPKETQDNLKAASVSPLDYVLQMQVEKAAKNQNNDWVQTKLEFKQLKFTAHVLTETNPDEVQKIMIATEAVKPQIKKV